MFSIHPVLRYITQTLADLMAENQTLRSLLRGVAAFIGEGAGGLLPKLGWDATEFNNFINKSETDTAWEGYQKRKKAQVSGAVPATMQSRKRTSEDDLLNRSKKPRNDDNSLEDQQNGFSLLVQAPQSSVAPPSLYSATQTQERPAMFAELMQGPNGSQIFMQPSTLANSAQYPAPSGSNLNSYPPSYVSGVNMSMEQPMSSSDGSSMQRSNPIEPPDEMDDEDDPKRNEAYKLIR